MVEKSDLLVSAVYNSLYSSALTHNDSKWPEKQTAKAIIQNDSEWFRSSFNNKTSGSLDKSGFNKVKYYNPKQIIFQHMSVKENVFNDR